MIASDSGWKSQNLGRCYNRYTRVVKFEKEASQIYIEEMVKTIKSKMYGQMQTVNSVNEGGSVVTTFVDTVDSGD